MTVETLNVDGMKRNRRLARAISDAGMVEFVRQLEYKCGWHGTEFRRVDRWYPSSRTCSGCGAVKQSLQLSERTYRCNLCGWECDRDENAAGISRRSGGQVGRRQVRRPVRRASVRTVGEAPTRLPIRQQHPLLADRRRFWRPERRGLHGAVRLLMPAASLQWPQPRRPVGIRAWRVVIVSVFGNVADDPPFCRVGLGLLHNGLIVRGYAMFIPVVGQGLQILGGQDGTQQYGEQVQHRQGLALFPAFLNTFNAALFPAFLNAFDAALFPPMFLPSARP